MTRPLAVALEGLDFCNPARAVARRPRSQSDLTPSARVFQEASIYLDTPGRLRAVRLTRQGAALVAAPLPREAIFVCRRRS